ATVGDRDAGVGRRRDPRADSRHNFEWHARATQLERLLAAATKDKRVAALETNHPLTGPTAGDQERSRVSLGDRRSATLLTDKDALGGVRAEVEQRGSDQPVVHHNLGAAEQ